MDCGACIGGEGARSACAAQPRRREAGKEDVVSHAYVSSCAEAGSAMEAAAPFDLGPLVEVVKARGVRKVRPAQDARDAFAPSSQARTLCVSLRFRPLAHTSAPENFALATR